MNETENLILRKQQLEESLVELINKADLPAFVIRPILNELCSQVMIQEHQQLDLAIQRKKENELKEGKDERNKKS